MPCNSSDLYTSADGNDSSILAKKLTNVEAQLCAILRELEKSNATHIIADAEKNGGVDITSFKQKHFAEDDKRINQMIDNDKHN
jgi:hypothetical protein